MIKSNAKGTVRVYDSLFQSNEALNTAPALLLSSHLTPNQTIVISNSQFMDNSANGRAGSGNVK